jgi:uncharacterized repeat protein (TIGR03803 family)
MTVAGSKQVLYRFQGGADGGSPLGSLINISSTLYGVTLTGGSGGGTVFSVSKTGTERVLHAFTSSGGHGPTGGLVDLGGLLYGTTDSGGAHNRGTVFALNP